MQYRWHVYKSIREAIDKNEGGLEKFSQGYKFYGLNRGEKEGKTGTWYREWAPGARVCICRVGASLSVLQISRRMSDAPLLHRLMLRLRNKPGRVALP